VRLRAHGMGLVGAQKEGGSGRAARGPEPAPERSAASVSRWRFPRLACLANACALAALLLSRARCANARREFAATPGCSGNLPIETEAGQGSACGHWRCVMGVAAAGTPSSAPSSTGITARPHPL
jgi:hypothetical protein